MAIFAFFYVRKKKKLCSHYLIKENILPVKIYALRNIYLVHQLVELMVLTCPEPRRFKEHSEGLNISEASLS